MSRFASRVAEKVIEVDPTAIRGLSAIRRGLVVITVLLVGTAWLGLDVAVNAALAAFLVGLMDKGRSPRATWEVMGVATIVLALATAVSGALSSSVFALMAMLAVVAFVAGVSYAVDVRAPQIFIFAALLTSSHMVNPVDIHDVPISTLLVLCAGGLQTLVALAVAPLVGDLPERRELAATMRAIARNCAQLSAEEIGPAREGANQAAMSISSADNVIKRGDIASEDRTRYAVLLADLDTIRLEARAFTSRQHMGVGVPRQQNMLRAFALAARVLSLGADALAHRSRRSALVEMSAAMAHEGPAPEETRTANSVRASLAALPLTIEDILDRRRVHRELVENGQPMRKRIAAALAPDSMSLLYGYRMASAVIVASLVALAANIPEGSWVAVTAMMLLRPDGTPTAPRILLRAIGTVVAVAAILVIIWVSDGSQQTTLILITIVVCLNYAFAAVNYGAQTALMAMTVLLLLSLTHPNPEALAFERLVDVFLGCAIGTVFAFAMPIWRRGQLRTDVANYASAAGDWFEAVARSATSDPSARAATLGELRRRGNVTRDLRSKARTTLNTTLLEPPDARIDVGAIGVVLSWVRRATDAGIAAEALLRHGLPTDAASVTLAQQSGADLRQTAAVLSADSATPMPEVIREENRLARETIDNPNATRVTALLARGEIAAAAGLRASYRIRSNDGN